MLNTNKKIIIFVAALLSVVFIAITFVDLHSNSEPNVNNSEKKQLELKTESSLDTLATSWDWQGAKQHSEQIQKNSGNRATLPFTPQSVFDALQAVKLDKDGNLILDHDALLSLDEALERIHNKLDAESLRLLQELIRESLPGKAGEQTAQIVGQYYDYLQAKDEFSRINEGLSEEGREESVQTIVDDQTLYAELQALREVHLGSENTASLFRVTDANATYMFESMKLGMDPSLGEQEREAKRLMIQEQHIAQSVNIRDWPARYQAFQNEKRNILSSSIDEEEKGRQVARLLNQHFSPSEIDRIRYLNLGVI